MNVKNQSFILKSMSQERKKHTAVPGLKPRTSRILCERSDHWATKPRITPFPPNPLLLTLKIFTIPISPTHHCRVVTLEAASSLWKYFYHFINVRRGCSRRQNLYIKYRSNFGEVDVAPAKNYKVNKVEKWQKITAGLNPNHMHIFKPWKKRCAKLHKDRHEIV